MDEVSEPEQFWNELQAIVSKPCDSEDLIDDALRDYLTLTTQHKDDCLRSEYDISRCSYKLFASPIFAAHTDYVRRQIIYGLLQEDDSNTLHLIASFLLFDGRQNEVALRMLNEEGAFARLLELIQALRREDMDGGAGLHRLLMDLLYEMSRIQRMKIEDLVLVDDNFIRCLFDLIEGLSYDVSDPYHYPVIRVLLVLNEQFMISAHDPVDEQSSSRLTNKVIKVLSMYGSLYKTFGENIILLINREAETSLQLLTLKLLYLIFTTPSTYEYFFTNDLHVLVDILIRNLLDLPEEASALRHTYLRVLYPLLAHTQLRHPPHYKRDELRKVLSILVRGEISYGSEAEQEKIMHFEEVDETTRRLVGRCATVEWLRNVEVPATASAQEPAQEVTTIDTVLDQNVQHESPTDIGDFEASRTLSRTSTIPSSPDTASPTRIDSRGSSEAPGRQRKLSLAQRIGMNLEPASSSSLSVQAVAAQHEKPGIITPSRADGRTAADPDGETSTTRPPKIKPEPPKSRRWRGRQLAVDDDDHSTGASSDRNIIPEGVEASPTTTLTTPTTSTPTTSSSADRRNSASSSLAPSVPAHARRSASNPPPAVPPPRRSTHTTPSSSHHRAPAPGSSGPSRPAQKPLPPKARRGGRAQTLHAPTPTDSVESGASNASAPKESDAAPESAVPAISQPPPHSPESPVLEDPFSPASPTSPTVPSEHAAEHDAPVSVEEAVQNVSLH
ncbi:hypothetical protein NUU61_008157 [Penicillium alfredii]|uniref:SPIN90/Ldb17 leucine-rich domain-containing protein n=1 Tax=Penicillium alfredii TaxID=1506179 RepID=A0A9W9JZ51_9EURO|nr:uncharacterized protein NUU61_008157 [Penicillium alfredii]KAJ5086850.1 hypothetical protein NUU61_008157 [Penicillium alfredii]